MSDYVPKHLPPADAPVPMAVVTVKQFERLKDIDLCIDSLSKIASADNYPDFVDYDTLLRFLSGALQDLCEEIEVSQPEGQG